MKELMLKNNWSKEELEKLDCYFDDDKAEELLSYDNQTIDNGQIIIFNKGNIRLVHRVIDIKNVNGQLRYYTKGDANEDLDAGYITKGDIVGTTDIKISYIGYPTLWLREIIAN